MESELYYTAPKEEIFQELKDCSIEIWSSYNDEHGYASEKINKIKSMDNYMGNFMHIIGMFDLNNQKKLSEILSEECCDQIIIRMINGGRKLENIFF